jgi:SHS2 domain-containing protein
VFLAYLKSERSDFTQSEPGTSVNGLGFSMFEFFEHTADVGIRVQGDTLEIALAEAGRALSSLIVENLDAVRPSEYGRIHLPLSDTTPDSLDYLLFDWLNVLLAAFEMSRRVFSQFDLRLTTEGIVADCRGESLDPARHRLGHEVKAITYHQLQFRQTGDGGYAGQVIVDL